MKAIFISGNVYFYFKCRFLGNNLTFYSDFSRSDCKQIILSNIFILIIYSYRYKETKIDSLIYLIEILNLQANFPVLWFQLYKEFLLSNSEQFKLCQLYYALPAQWEKKYRRKILFTVDNLLIKEYLLKKNLGFGA